MIFENMWKKLMSFVTVRSGQMDVVDYIQARDIIRASKDFNYYADDGVLRYVSFCNGLPKGGGYARFTFRLPYSDPARALFGTFDLGDKKVTREEPITVTVKGRDVTLPITRTISDIVPNQRRVDESPWLAKLYHDALRLVEKRRPADFRYINDMFFNQK